MGGGGGAYIWNEVSVSTCGGPVSIRYVVVWCKICVTCMNFLASLHSFIFVFSRNLCVFMLLLTI